MLESPLLWVHSAPVTVHPGQVVKISGWVRIDQPLSAGPDGCLISDSVSGPDLALRLRKTQGWQPFQMLRSVHQNDHLSVTITLTAPGEVCLDDLQICVRPTDPQMARGKGKAASEY